MKIIIESSTCKGEVEITPGSDVHDYLDVITGALIMEGFQTDTIIEGYENKAHYLKTE